MKPLIGITPNIRKSGKFALHNAYVNSVIDAGGLPIILPYNTGNAKDYLKNIAGLVLSGGGDMDPCHYNQDKHPKTEAPNAARDSFELELCRHALEMDIPLLGVCRGLQVLNVACGGTLTQHIDGHLVTRDPAQPHVRWQTYLHSVKLQGKLRDIIGKDEINVNSIHHQVVGQLGADVYVNATAGEITANEIIEAVEVKGKKFALGVQWHPEALAESDKDHAAIFAAFIGAIR